MLPLPRRATAASFLATALFAFTLLSATPTAAQTFTRITTGPVATNAGNTSGVAWVDYDGDGDDDIFAANRSGDVNVLYRNNGDGTFSRLSSATFLFSSSIGSSWADYDNDGDLDVCLSGSPCYLFRNDGGTFVDRSSELGPPSGVIGWACAWGDWDNDGFVDLIITFPVGFLPGSSANRMFHNNGDGTFTEITGEPPTMGPAPYTGATWSDHDDDGDIDLFIGSGPANGTQAVDYLYRNRLVEDGTASFERITTAPIATDLVDGQVWNWVDYDADGDLDAFLTNWSGGVAGGQPDNLYRHDGASFTRIASGAMVTDLGFSLSQVWQDFDNDGDLDVFVTNALSSQPNRYYANDGDGTFTRSFSKITSDFGLSWADASADYHGDGDMDLLVGNAATGSPGNPKFLYRNDTVNPDHWLGVRLTGTRSNRSGIGAKVRVKAVIDGTSQWQRQDVSAQNTFCGQNSLKLHFGLGNAAVVESLRVEWPSGLADTMTGVAVDTCIDIEEGVTGPVPVELTAFAAERTEDGVAVSWTAVADLDDQARFFVNRGDGAAPRHRVSPAGFDGAGSFRFQDREAPDGPADYWLEEITRTAAVRWHGPLHVAAAAAAGFTRPVAAPNPFRESTTIRFRVERPGRVTISVFDASGRPVTELADRIMEAGTASVGWDGTDSGGRHVSPGVYFYRLDTPGRSVTDKILRLGI